MKLTSLHHHHHDIHHIYEAPSFYIIGYLITWVIKLPEIIHNNVPKLHRSKHGHLVAHLISSLFFFLLVAVWRPPVVVDEKDGSLKVLDLLGAIVLEAIVTYVVTTFASASVEVYYEGRKKVTARYFLFMLLFGIVLYLEWP